MTGHVLGICFLILIGFLGIWQVQRLPLGTLKNPGAGFFPFWISLILCGLGVLSLVNLFMGQGRLRPVSGPALRPGGVLVLVYSFYGLRFNIRTIGLRVQYLSSRGSFCQNRIPEILVAKCPSRLFGRFGLLFPLCLAPGNAFASPHAVVGRYGNL